MSNSSWYNGYIMTDNFLIRQPKPEDAPTLAEIHVTSWQAAYRGLLPDELLANLSVSQRMRFWQRSIAEQPETIWVGAVGKDDDENDRLVGFVHFGPSRDDDADPQCCAEIYAIYLASDCWGKGYGAALWEKARQSLQAYDEIMLWVLKGNNRAIRFYEQAGFYADGGEKTENYRDQATLHELRYRTQHKKEGTL